MKYLTKAFQEKFIEDCGKLSRNSGKLFEELVETILQKLFPLLTWRDTPISHDGSKDFYAQKNGKIYWAECKNHNDSISLQTIAPTLVMAQLCNADEVYFFSFSKINDNTKKKLCYYANINQKKVRFYDDIVLEQIIFNHKSIYDRYFKEYQFTDINFKKEAVPQILYNYLKNPFLNYKKEDTFLRKNDISNLKVNEILSLHICSINNNSTKNATITIQINPRSKDLLCFELLDYTLKRSAIVDYRYSKTIAPNEVLFHSINFKIISYKPQLTIPELIVNVRQDDYVDNKNLSWGSFQCSLLHKSAFLGPFYQDILSDMEENMVNVNKLAGLLLIGTSGTGKSRTLEEAISLFVKYNYKVMNFIGVENDSGQNILKEIIYIVFEVSEELIMESFTVNEKNTALNKIFKMLYEINTRKISFKEIIDVYGEVIFERLVHRKYAIIIDNIQYYDDSLLYFLEKLILYSKNCNRDNKLFLAFSINTDYSCNESIITGIKTLFQQLHNTSTCIMKTWELKGFSSEGTALEFIKQLLGIKNTNYDYLFRKVINKASLNPYYIESIVENLNSFKSVSHIGNRFIIDDSMLFIDELGKVPDRAKDKIKMRWDYFIEKHSRKSDYETILSVIHTFGECRKELLEKLKLRKELLKNLCDYKFLKKVEITNVVKYVFIHDLMEKFFCENIYDFEDIAYAYLEKIGFAHLRNTYPIVYNLCLLHSENYNIKDLESIIENGNDIGIPYKIFYSYFKKCVNALLENYERFSDKYQWYALCNDISVRIKLRLGNKTANEILEQIFNSFENGCFEDRFSYKSFSDLLFYYGEIKQQLTFYYDVIGLYLKYLQHYDKIKRKKSDELIQSTITFIYNRLSVAYKNLPGLHNRTQQVTYINKSLYLSRTLENRQYLAENCYDKGKYYYYHVKYKKKVLAYWKSCCSLIKKYKIELMTLHRIEHKIQIALIEQNLDEIPLLLEQGFDYIDHGKYNEEGLYFKNFFNQAKAIFWLFKKENYDIVSRSLSEAEEAMFMLGKNNLAYINYLRGKLYFYKQDMEHTYEYYKEAYRQSLQLTILYKEFFADNLVEDMLIKFRQLNIDRNIYPLDFLTKIRYKTMAEQLFSMSPNDFIKYCDNYKATSIIQSLDGRENFPNI